jgi:tetratricopeptide (TPR) repeat protein
MSILDKYDVGNNKHDEIKYKALISIVYEKLGKHEEALRAYKEYMVVSDSTLFAIMQQDTKFVEERHALEMAKAKETEAKNKRTIAVLACVVALIGSLLVIMIIRRRLQISHAKNRELEVEKQKYEQLYADAIAERDALTKMVEDSSVREEAKAVIKARLDVLNKVIISQITGTTSANKKAYEELELLLADKETFIESTRLTIEGNNPEFITALKRRGLTDEEINICCLYAIGLKGKDIKAYTSQPRHYNQSADIRHKLGLTESDTNLSIFLRDMLEK